MRIQCLQPFLDGRERFEKDDIFTIDDERGADFVRNGWARDTAGTEPATVGLPTPSTTDLSIDNTTLGTGDSNG